MERSPEIQEKPSERKLLRRFLRRLVIIANLGLAIFLPPAVEAQQVNLKKFLEKATHQVLRQQPTPPPFALLRELPADVLNEERGGYEREQSERELIENLNNPEEIKEFLQECKSYSMPSVNKDYRTTVSINEWGPLNLEGPMRSLLHKFFGDLGVREIIEERAKQADCIVTEFNIRWFRGEDVDSRAEFFRVITELLKSRIGVMKDIRSLQWSEWGYTLVTIKIHDQKTGKVFILTTVGSPVEIARLDEGFSQIWLNFAFKRRGVTIEEGRGGKTYRRTSEEEAIFFSTSDAISKLRDYINYILGKEVSEVFPIFILENT